MNRILRAKATLAQLWPPGITTPLAPELAPERQAERAF